VRGAPPPKLCRFMTPAKPLPIEVPVTSTNWPTTKWSAVSSAPTVDQVRPGSTAELDELALRLDLGGREVAASAPACSSPCAGPAELEAV
jgi:hypothetical protein